MAADGGNRLPLDSLPRKQGRGCRGESYCKGIGRCF